MWWMSHSTYTRTHLYNYKIQSKVCFVQINHTLLYISFMFKLICCALLSDTCNYILSLKPYCLWPCSCPEDENNKLPALLPEMSGGGMDSQAPQSPHCRRRGRRLHTGAPQHWPHQERKGKNWGRDLLWLTYSSL